MNNLKSNEAACPASAPVPGSALPWNGVALLIMLPALLAAGCLIGAVYGAWKAVEGGFWSAYHRKPGEWEWIKPPNAELSDAPRKEIEDEEKH